jgi:hypothetical protein
MAHDTNAEAPFHRAAFINAITEEGSKAEAVEWLQKTWNEKCQIEAERDFYKAQAERVSSQLEAVRTEMEHVVECLCEEAEQTRDESLKERSYKLAESCEATLAQIDAEPAEPRQPTGQGDNQ